MPSGKVRPPSPNALIDMASFQYRYVGCRGCRTGPRPNCWRSWTCCMGACSITMGRRPSAGRIDSASANRQRHLTPAGRCRATSRSESRVRPQSSPDAPKRNGPVPRAVVVGGIRSVAADLPLLRHRIRIASPGGAMRPITKFTSQNYVTAPRGNSVGDNNRVYHVPQTSQRVG